MLLLVMSNIDFIFFLSSIFQLLIWSWTPTLIITNTDTMAEASDWILLLEWIRLVMSDTDLYTDIPPYFLPK